jgi:site-specific recombinase XerD
MRLRNYSPKTIKTYVAGVARFAKHFKRSPDQLGLEEVRAFQLHLLDQHVSWCVFNQTVCAIRLFYRLTLGRVEQLPFIPYGKKPQTLPVVLSPEEVLRFIEAASPGRGRVLLQTAYACGLRISELVNLRVTDIDSARMVIVVRQGKGRKDRLVPLSPRLLAELRAYWLQTRSPTWLFPGASRRNSDKPLHTAIVHQLCRTLVARLGLSKRVTPHTLRHSFATHMLEAGVDLVTLKTILGHRHLQSTAHYLHLSVGRIPQLPSLLDRLMVSTPTPAPATEEGRS